MTRFAGDGLDVEFDETWSVAEKWDETTAYRDGLEKLDGSSAVDFVALKDRTLFLVEAKVYMGEPSAPHREAIAKSREQLAELPNKIGQKVRDTVAGLLGAYRRTEAGTPQPWLKSCVDALVGTSRVHVVVWILEPASRPGEPHGKRAMRKKVRHDRIEATLEWLTSLVSVLDPARDRCPTGLSVKRLPTGGRR